MHEIGILGKVALLLVLIVVFYKANWKYAVFSSIALFIFSTLSSMRSAKLFSTAPRNDNGVVTIEGMAYITENGGFSVWREVFILVVLSAIFSLTAKGLRIMIQRITGSDATRTG